MQARSRESIGRSSSPRSFHSKPFRQTRRRWPIVSLRRCLDIRGSSANGMDASLVTRTRRRHRERKAYQWSVDTSAYVHPEYWRRGIGRGLYRSLFEILSAQGFMNAYAAIALPNAGSVGLHESVGFRPVGVYRSVGYKLGAWHDVGWWQLGLRNHEPSPSEPVDLVTVQGRKEWPTLLTSGISSIRSDERAAHEV